MHINRLREMDIFSLEKRRQGGDLVAVYSRTGLEDGASPFSEEHSDGNRHKLQQGKFHIQGKRGKISSGWPNTGIGCPEKMENLQSL